MWLMGHVKGQGPLEAGCTSRLHAEGCTRATSFLEEDLMLPGQGHVTLVRVLSHFIRVRLFAAPWTVAHQAPLSMRFSRQEYWSGLPFSRGSS